MAANEITGDSLVSKAATSSYRDGHDRIFNPPITGVAIRANGVMHTLPAPKRHANILHTVDIDPNAPDYCEGFVDANGNFLDRLEGMKRAVKTGQFSRIHHPPNHYQGPKLFSEDLWGPGHPVDERN